MRLTTELAGPFRLAVFAGAVAAVLVPGPGAAQGLKMTPVDQASQDPSFVEYRTALLDGVRARDAGRVVAMAAPDIMLSFGGSAGSESFRRNFSGTESWQGEAYWNELQRILELGGVFFEDGAFCSPYLACLDVPGCPDCDPFETVFVTGRDVMARAKPAAGAQIVARLSYDVLRLDVEAYAGDDWYPVHLPGGGKAFVYAGDARMSIDYRARFEKLGGRWRMTVFIAGD